MEKYKWQNYSKVNLLVISIFMVLCYIGILAQYTIMNQYIFNRISSDNNNLVYSNISQCYINRSNHNDVQSKILAEVARYNIYSQLSSGIPSMIAVVIFGIMSDFHGRKLLIMISWIGLFVGTLFNIFLIRFNGPLWLYILGQFLAGLGGNYGAMITGVLSLISDSTSKRTRNFGIVVIEFTLGISMVISQALLGIWLKSKDFFGPIITFGTIFMISGLVWIFINETKPKTASSHEFSYKYYIYISIVKMIKIFTLNSKVNVCLFIILTVFFIHTLNFFGNLSLITVYLFGKPFCWNSEILGYYRSISSAIIQFGMLFSLLLIKYRVNEILIIELGFVTSIMAKMLFGIAPSFSKNVADFIIYAASLDLLSGAAVSLLRSVSSKLVSPDEFGSLFGVMSCLETLSSLIGGVLFNSIYENSFIFYYGITYIFSAALLFIAFMLMLAFYWKRYRSHAINYYTLED